MGAGTGKQRAGLLLVCLLLLLSPFRAWAAEEEPTAEDLTSRCTLTLTGSVKGLEAMLKDGQTRSSIRMTAKDELLFQSDRDMATLLLRISQMNAAFSLLEKDKDGLVLAEETMHTDAAALSVPLAKGCRWVQLQPLEDTLYLCEAAVFGPGPLPDKVPHPDAPLQKADFLLVATHPDDEWVFLGGVYPIYGGERGYAGTVVYVTMPYWERGQECINGLWIGGVRTHPFFLGFPDIQTATTKRQRDRFKQEDVALALVRLYRRIRPLVVVTQDPKNGEYGHWQHKISARAALEAVHLAADPAYDPESAAQYGVWTVQKLYQHLVRSVSRLELDVDAPLASYGGQTAVEVARAAYSAHKSQKRTPFRPGSSNLSNGDIRRFGLVWSAVGPDTANDLFDHIPEEDLAINWKPTPAPTMTPTPNPTGTPSPEPTATPALTMSPTPEPTPEPTATAEPAAAPSAWDRAEERALWAADHAPQLSAGIVLLVAALAALRQYRRTRHRQRQQEKE